MVLPTYEDISINKTKWFVGKHDLESFDQWTKTLNEIVTPFEQRIKECEIKNIVQQGHIIEGSIELLNEEVLRMLRWSKKEHATDIEKLAKNFKDAKDKYIKARDTLENDCACKHK